MLTICLLLPFVPSGLSLPVAAAVVSPGNRMVVNVSTWNELYNSLIDYSSNKYVVLTDDITLSGSLSGGGLYVDVLTRVDDVIIDGQGHSIIFPDNTVLSRDFGRTELHGGVGLLGAMYNSQLKNIEFKMLGDVHVGEYQHNTYDGFNPNPAFDIGYVGLVASTISSNSTVENVSIVTEDDGGTFYVKINDMEYGNNHMRMSAGLLAGVVSDNVTVNGVYIDANIEAGVHEFDYSPPQISVGGMFGRYYPNETSGNKTTINNFMLQGEVTAFTGNSSVLYSGGIIGMLYPAPLHASNNPDHVYNYNISFSNGLVNMKTNAHTVDHSVSEWSSTGYTGWGFTSASYSMDEVWSGGQPGDHYPGNFPTNTNVHVIYSSDTALPGNIKMYAPVDATTSFSNINTFDNNWITVSSGSVYDGNIALKWLVNPYNEDLTLAANHSGDIASWNNNDLLLTSTNPIYSNVDTATGRWQYSWTLNATMSSKGKLGTVNSVRLEQSATGITDIDVTYRTNVSGSVGETPITPPEPTYVAGGTYYFQATVDTVGLDSVDNSHISWSLKDSTGDALNNTSGDPIYIDNYGKLVISSSYLSPAPREITIVASTTDGMVSDEHDITIIPVSVAENETLEGSQYYFGGDSSNEPNRTLSLHIPISFDLQDSLYDEEATYNIEWDYVSGIPTSLAGQLIYKDQKLQLNHTEDPNDFLTGAGPTDVELKFELIYDDVDTGIFATQKISILHDYKAVGETDFQITGSPIETINLNTDKITLNNNSVILGTNTPTSYYILNVTQSDTQNNGDIYYSTDEGATWQEYTSGNSIGDPDELWVKSVPVDPSIYTESDIFEINSITGGTFNIAPGSIASTSPPFTSGIDPIVYRVYADDSNISNGVLTKEVTINDIFGTSFTTQQLKEKTIVINVENNHKYSYRGSAGSYEREFVGASVLGYRQFAAGALSAPILEKTENIALDAPLKLINTSSDPTAQIYYVVNNANSINPTDLDITNQNQLYNHNVGINLLNGYAGEINIRAVTVVGGEVSEELDVDLDADDFITPPPPVLSRVGGSIYSTGQAYDDGAIVDFAQPSGWSGEGWIVWDYDEPAGPDDLKLNGTIFNQNDDGTKPKVTEADAVDGVITIYAIFISNVADKISEVGEFNIRVFDILDVGNVSFNYTDTHIVTDSELFTSFPSENIAEYILADNVSSMTYGAANTADEVLQDNYPRVSITGSPSADVENYVSYERASDEDIELPIMRVLPTTTRYNSDFEKYPSSYQYTYPTREVVFTYSPDGSVESVNVIYTDPDHIDVSSYIRATYTTMYVYVQLYPAVDTDAYVKQSEKKEFIYQKAPSAGTVTMSPSPTGNTAFNESTEITLSYDPAGSESENDVTYFYTVNGGEPAVQYNPNATNDLDRWTPLNSSTKRYENRSFFLNSTSENTRVYWKVVGNENDFEPTTGYFSLTLTALPAAPAPTPHYENGATVISGEPLYFYPDSALQSNHQIYYTIGGGIPDPYAYIEYLENNNNIPPAEGHVQGTYLYDASGVEANFAQGSTTLVIVAVIVDTGTPRQYSTSPSVRVEYRIREAGTPTSLPSTDLNDIAVVEPGDSILLFSSTSNAQIFYTTDSTDPQVDTVTDTNGVTSYVPAANTTTQLYATDNVPIMPSGTQSFFTIRAVAYSDDYSKSAEALLLFQPPEPVQAVSPSISPYQPVARNTPISFTTTTENSTILYKTYDTLAEAQADAVTVDADGNTVPVPLSATNGTLFNEELPIILTEDMVIRVVAERQSVQSAETFYEFTVAPQLKSPTMSLPSGSIIYPGAVISIDNSGAGEIRYTTNGDDPKVADATDLLYGNSFVVTADYGDNITVKVYTAATGYTESETVVYNYTVVSEAGYITSTPAVDSVVQGGTNINLSTTISGGKIYYSTDSSLPSTSGDGGDSTESVPVEGNPGDTFTIKALVATDGATPGNIVVYNYIMAEKTPAPTANIPNGAVYLDGAAVTLTSKDGSIFYTLDGNEPTTSSALYQSPIILTGESVTLKAIAVLDESENSDVVTYNYTRAGDTDPPTFSQNGGTIETGYALSITTSTAGAQIYYSTDGTEPTTLNIDDLFLYTEPIVITKPVTVKAIAVSEQRHMSTVVEAYFLVAEPEEDDDGEHTGNLIGNTSFDGLQSRRDYYGTDGGPTYQENILSDELNSVIASFPDATLEDGAEMTVISQNASDTHRDAVSELGMDVSKLYNVTFMKDNSEVTPSGEFEIGLPIEAGYENSEVVIVRMNNDGTITTFPVRRSGGMVYAMVDGPGLYSVAVSSTAQESGGGVFGWFDDFLKWLRLLF